MKMLSLRFLFAISCGAAALDFACGEIIVDDKLPAGNIVFEKIEGDKVFVHQDLRDTKKESWFYWAMRVRGAEGRTLEFRFTKDFAVGVRGPIVSLDKGKTFFYGAEKDASRHHFVYTFPKDANEVYFYQTFPYMPSDWMKFIEANKDSEGERFETGVLCKTKKGRVVQRARFGRLDGNAKYRAFVCSRNHCGETMGTFVVEGLCQAFLDDDELGQWLRENVELLVVPIVDVDGAVDGDQGKFREPHDHNRDYNHFIYPETKALTEWILGHTKGKLDIFLDVHCPWLFGKYNEFVYTPFKNPKLPNLDQERERRYSRILEENQSGVMRYQAKDDLDFGVAWNTGKNYHLGWSSVVWAFNKIPGIKLSRSYEVPFHNANGVRVTPCTCREFGRDTAKAFKAFLEELEK